MQIFQPYISAIFLENKSVIPAVTLFLEVGINRLLRELGSRDR